MVSEDPFYTFTAKGINLHQCKRKVLGGLQNKIYSVSKVQICDRSCETLAFLCATFFESPESSSAAELKSVFPNLSTRAMHVHSNVVEHQL